MKLLEIPFGSSLYEQELKLRDQFLRKPLGLSLTARDVEDEESQLHYGCCRMAFSRVAWSSSFRMHSV